MFNLLNKNHKFIDLKYINLISHRLPRFKRKKANLFNFRCHICGDSHKNEYKARGYIYEKKGSFFFTCHNCGSSSSLYNLIKDLSPSLHKEYVLEIMAENEPNEKKTTTNKQDIIDINHTAFLSKPVFFNYKKSPLKLLKKISQLKETHPFKKYVVERKIPNFYHSRLFYCPAFMRFTNSLIPLKFSEKAVEAYDEPRLIIPLIDRGGNLIGYQGRSLSKDSKLRYITIMLDEETPKIYGLDMINIDDEFIFVVEGPLDSMFVKNCLAMCGADVISEIEKLGFDKNKLVFVYDNEPRNSQIVKRIKATIKKGYRVVIFPPNIEQKDINDLRLVGWKEDFIQDMLENNIYEGLKAEMKINYWKKI